MPYLVQVLLPLYDNAGTRFPTDHYDEVRDKLTGQFGGSTAYTRAPAEGLWNSGGTVKRDDIVVVEVMGAVTRSRILDEVPARARTPVPAR